MDKKPLHPTTQYAKDVIDGKIVTGNLVKLACKRHLADLKRKDIYFCEESANRVFTSFNYFHHSEGKWAGQVIKLEPWQQFIAGSMAGWKVKDTGKRRFKFTYVQIAKKNGKSTFAGGLGLYFGFLDGEGGAQTNCIATKEEQAKIVWDMARRIVLKSPVLKKIIKPFARSLACDYNYSKFIYLGADSKTQDGINTYFGIVDEYHAHPNDYLYGNLISSMGAREQPLALIITTAGFNTTSPCYEMYQMCVKILKKTIQDDSYFCYIAQLDEGDDPFDEKNWIKASPNYKISVYEDFMISQARLAQNNPSLLNNFLVKNLNCWVQQKNRYIPMDKWKKMDKVINLEDLKGCNVVIGMDLSSTTDFSSISVLAEIDGNYYNYSRFYLPEDKITEYELQGKYYYRQWEKEGYICATPGDVIDYDFIKHDIMEISKICNISEIGYDPWNATTIANDLKNDGFIMVEVRQGYFTLSEPTKQLVTLICQKKLYHGNNPVLTFCAENMTVKTDENGNVRPSKDKGINKIDGVVALILSLSRLIVNPTEQEKEIEVSVSLL